jgi:hypothetical protein
MRNTLPGIFFDDLQELCDHHTTQGVCTGCMFQQLLKMVEALWRGAVDAMSPQELRDVLDAHGIRYNGEPLLSDTPPTDLETAGRTLH